MRALTDYSHAALAALFSEWAVPSAHAPKLLRALYHGAPVELGGLRLGKALQQRVAAELPLRQSRIQTERVSADGTRKLLLELDGGGVAECVLMSTPRPERAAGCVSSQIGCAMGCDFCASTRRGLERNLTAGEIVEQFLHLKHAAVLSGRRLATLVFMGMGEPLHNFDNVVEAIERIASPQYGALGWRQVTVSTVGIVPGILALAERNLNINLALSLHAPDDATRAKIVPANRRFPVREIVDATRAFYEKTGRIVNLEYVLLDGVNDSADHARMLADLLDGFRAHINLIPYNYIGTGVSGTVYRRPPAERVQAFLDALRARRFVAHVRVTRGDDVSAACGQLRENAYAEVDARGGR